MQPHVLVPAAVDGTAVLASAASVAVVWASAVAVPAVEPVAVP